MCRKAGKQASRDSDTVQLDIRMGKRNDLNNFEPCMIVTASSVPISHKRTPFWAFHAQQGAHIHKHITNTPN